MEVHHALHPTHKKKWTEYLLEFLMLFLAVFLGFLAENFREHKVEKHRVEQHMHTMVENLKFDTTRYGTSLNRNLILGNGLDSFRYQILEAINGRVDANRLYYLLWKYGRSVSYAVTNASAMTQLKSSGMLRMIKNDSLANQMSDYYERRYSTLETARESIVKKRDEVNESYRIFFSYIGFDELLQRDTIMVTGTDVFRENYTSRILTRDPPLQLRTEDKNGLKQLYEDVASVEIFLRNYDSRLRYCYEGAIILMKHIREEYGIN